MTRRPLCLGVSGINFPPIEAGQQAAQSYEAAGVDFIGYWDQLNLTIPRSIWTPDLVPAAELWDIDAWLEPWPTMTAGALVTDRIRFMTVCDGTRRPPSITAQLALTMDQITKGRFLLCMGAGEAKQSSPYGLSRSKPFGHLEEALKIIKMYFESTEPISYDGPVWKLHNAIVGIEPYGTSPPPIVVAGGPGKAMKFAATLADGWLTYFPPCASVEQYAEQVVDLRKMAEEAGKDPDELIIMAMMLCLVAGDEAQVEEICHNPAARWDAAAVAPDGASFRRMCGRDNPLGADWSYSRDLIPMDISREYALSTIDQMTPEDVRATRFAGTPRQVADQLQPYVDCGITHLVALNWASLLSTGDYGDGAGGQQPLTDLLQLVRAKNG